MLQILTLCITDRLLRGNTGEDIKKLYYNAVCLKIQIRMCVHVNLCVYYYVCIMYIMSVCVVCLCAC